MFRKIISIFIAVVLMASSLAFSVNAAPNKVKAKSISIRKTLTMKKGSSKTLKCTFKPKNVITKKVKWKSSNTKIVTVSSKGKVRAKKSGIAVITASTKDGTKLKARCTVRVLNKTVNDKIKNNLSALKDFIIQNGDENKSGEKGLFATEDNYSFAVIYSPENETLEFGFTDHFTDDPDDYYIDGLVEMEYSLSGYDYCTAECLNIYHEYGGTDDFFTADVIINTASYNPDSVSPKIVVKQDTFVSSNSTVKKYVSTSFKLAMSTWDYLLLVNTGLRLSDIGFTNYHS